MDFAEKVLSKMTVKPFKDRPSYNLGTIWHFARSQASKLKNMADYDAKPEKVEVDVATLNVLLASHLSTIATMSKYFEPAPVAARAAVDAYETLQQSKLYQGDKASISSVVEEF